MRYISRITLLLALAVLPGSAFGQYLAIEDHTDHSAPNLRIIQQNAESVTYELTATWQGRLVDGLRPTLSSTVVESTGGLTFVSAPLQLRSTAAPIITVLASDFDEVPLNLAEEEVAMSGLDRPVAEVVDVGIERRVPMGTVVASYLRVDLETQTLRRYRRVIFRVDLPGTTGLVPQGGTVANPHLEVESSVLATGTWYKVPVRRSGVVRIDRAFISALGANPASVDPANVGIYSTGGAVVPAWNSAPRIADLARIPALIVGGGDGQFGESDAIYFYAEGPYVWEWNQALVNVNQPGWMHTINPYSNDNYYFIRIDDSTPSPFPGHTPSTGSTTTLSQVLGRIFIEEDEPDGMVDRDHGGSGLDWLGRNITPTRNRMTVLDTLPPDFSGGDVEFRGRIARRNTAAGSLGFYRGTQVLRTSSWTGASSGLFVATTLNFTRNHATSEPFSIDLLLQGGGTATGWIDYIQAFYPQNLNANQDYLHFATPGGQAGNFEFVLSGFSSEPHVWDVTRTGQKVRLPVTQSGNSYHVRITVEDPQVPREIVAFTTGSSRIRVLSSNGAVPVTNQNLHGFAGNPEYIVITHRDFWAEGEAFVAHRTSQGLESAVFDIDEIYNEFSGGKVDPRGMRDFIRFIYEKSPGTEPRLRYVLLLGGGSYDYRNIRGTAAGSNFVPSFQTYTSASDALSFTTDDYFGLLSPDDGDWWESNSGHPGRLDVGLGRIPVRTPQEAADALAKIQRYENPETQGAWRTLYTFLSDDHRPNNWDSDYHVQNSEYTIDSVSVYVPGFNFKKIYMGSYPLIQTAEGARYPAATTDAIRSLELGTLIWNYYGHGSPMTLADERLITRDQIRDLTNFDRLTVAITATCSFGRYDLAGERSGGDEFILNPNGGAIASFTTTRIVNPGQTPGDNTLGVNVVLNRYLLTVGEDGLPRRFGDAYRLMKREFPVSINARKFNLLGDPATRFALPIRDVAVTEINGVILDQDETGIMQLRTAEASLDEVQRLPELTLTRQPSISAGGTGNLPTLTALELATIQGEVRDMYGNLDSSYHGEVEVTVYDAERTFTLAPETNITYTQGSFAERADMLYRGRATVSGGIWQTEFIVPQDVSYSGERARISVYSLTSAGNDGMGVTEDVLIGTGSGVPLDDFSGPRIRLFLNDTTFAQGGLTPNQPLLIARLEDDSGINMAGVGVGHDMRLVINGREAEAINLAPFYQSDLNTFRSGSVQYRLPELNNGPNTLSLTAWDVVNNSSTATLDFVIEDSDQLRIAHAYPYPNPTTGPTRFVFEHNQVPGTLAKVQIRIYTLSGRPIRTLDGFETLPEGVLTGSPVQIPWDGRDEDFDELATGIYLYRVRVEVETGDGERRVAERIERLAIIR